MHRYQLPTAILLAFAMCAEAQRDARTDTTLRSPLVGQAIKESTSNQARAGERFWKEVERRGTPLFETSPDHAGKVLVTFLWRTSTPAVDVRVYGDFIDPSDKAGAKLERVANTDIWQRSFVMDDAARFRYYLVAPRDTRANPAAVFTATIDGVTYEAFRDTRNPKTLPVQDLHEVDEVSYAEGPAAPPEPFLTVRSNVARGKVETFQIDSAVLGNRRSISVYTPPGYDGSARDYPLLTLLDGREYQTSVPTPTILDNMTADAVIAPLVTVFIDNIDDVTRTRELPPRDARFTSFLAAELLPWVRKRYRVTTDPARSLIAGSSFGGLAALNAAFVHPELFGKAISLSGGFGWRPGDPRERGEPPALGPDCCVLMGRMASAPARPIEIYLDVGTWEDTDILLTNRQLRDLLVAKGYRLGYHEFIGGHDYVNWRGSLPTALATLIGHSGVTSK